MTCDVYHGSFVTIVKPWDESSTSWHHEIKHNTFYWDSVFCGLKVSRRAADSWSKANMARYTPQTPWYDLWCVSWVLWDHETALWWVIHPPLWHHEAEAYHGRSALRSAQLFFNFCGAMSASSYRALRLTKHEALRWTILANSSNSYRYKINIVGIICSGHTSVSHIFTHNVCLT